jgi:hypothetical protein
MTSNDRTRRIKRILVQKGFWKCRFEETSKVRGTKNNRDHTEPFGFDA